MYREASGLSIQYGEASEGAMSRWVSLKLALKAES